ATPDQHQTPARREAVVAPDRPGATPNSCGGSAQAARQPRRLRAAAPLRASWFSLVVPGRSLDGGDAELWRGPEILVGHHHCRQQSTGEFLADATAREQRCAESDRGDEPATDGSCNEDDRTRDRHPAEDRPR